MANPEKCINLSFTVHFSIFQLIALVRFHRAHHPRLQQQEAVKSSDEPGVSYLLSTKLQAIRHRPARLLRDDGALVIAVAEFENNR